MQEKLSTPCKRQNLAPLPHHWSRWCTMDSEGRGGKWSRSRVFWMIETGIVSTSHLEQWGNRVVIYLVLIEQMKAHGNLFRTLVYCLFKLRTSEN